MARARWLRRRRDRFAGLAVRLRASKLSNARRSATAIARERERTRGCPSARDARSSPCMQRLDARIAHSGQLLAALSYRGVLARGFALVRDEQGQPCTPQPQIGPGRVSQLEFADGRVGATADADRTARHRSPVEAGRPASRKRRRQARRKAGRQGSLF